ncbi:MAG: ECF transporter S component [Candidatus Thorarchaeota archaeon]
MSSPEEKSGFPSYYFETSDLVIISLFAALGGVFSSVIANIANLFNTLVAGGGQLFAGLHVFWFVLVYFLTRRKIGAVILTGIIKGLIELFMGNPLGIIVVLIAIGEAIVFEIVILTLSKLITQKYDHIRIVLAAGGSTSTNMIILLYILLGKGLPPELILLMLIFSFFSGIIFGGYLGIIITHVFQQSGLLDWRKEVEEI